MPRKGENIRKRKDGRWEGRFQAADARTGKRYYRSVYAKTYGEAKEKLSAAKAAYREEKSGKKAADAARGQVAFGDVAGEWFESIEKKKKHSTFVKYRNIYEVYIQPAFADVFLHELSPELINSVFPDSGEKSASILRSISCVTNQILKYAAARYQVSFLAASCEKPANAHRPVEVLGRSDQVKLLRYLYDTLDVYKAGIIVCLSTGLRLGEICALKWEDIDFENRLLRVNRTVQRISVQNQEKKTALLESDPKSCFSKREIPLTDNLIRLLLPYRAEDGYFLCSHKPMEPRTYQNKFAEYLMITGIKKTNFHILRHTFATSCIDSGTDVKSLSEILGHSDVRITLNRYVHPTTETKRQHLDALSVIYGQYMGQVCPGTP